MGLTIHYSYETRSTKPLRFLDKIRERALQLPFDEVGELRYYGPDICKHGFEHYRKKDDEAFDALHSANESLRCPWNKHIFFGVNAEEIHFFRIIVGEGCEWLELGLAKYPSVMEVEYRQQDDEAYWTTWKSGNCTTRGFDKNKYRRKTGKTWHGEHAHPSEKRTIRTRMGSAWKWSGFCKTQYAANPAQGGVPNFLRCHLSIIALLQWIRDQLGMKCSIDDEGCYERWHGYGVIGDESSLGWHPGHFSIEKLARTVGEWNTQLAAFCGALKDGAGESLQSEIHRFPDFEHLEAAGFDAERCAKWKMLGKWLKAAADNRG